ncbi:serine protease inhibitor 28Dc [Anthonomus grandis grandis]|uniref:serine protease inhibitor 28Dc n=1 Tax=Anthonomus grandis grandis TaxID=2921223 RepID=UPI002165D606|nr:serine protease inhibitor 28Dc [Anthonomus grandis grandis]
MPWYLNAILVITCLRLPTTENANNTNQQVYFPTEEDDIKFQISNAPPSNSTGEYLSPEILNKLTTLRGKTVYQEYVDEIISRGITKLTLKVNEILRHDQDIVVFSPLSIAGVLTLILLGSNGNTFKEVSLLLGLETGIPDINKKSQLVHEQFGRMLDKISRTSGFAVGEQVHVASALFIQKGYQIRPIYASLAEDLYRSKTVNVDYMTNPVAAQELINDWVANNTNKKIKTILSSPPSILTKAIITSALYFNAEWYQHFFPGVTKRAPFYVNGRDTPSNVQADMMANLGDFFTYYRSPTLECEILGLPYKGNRSTMYVIMPFNSSKTKLKEFEQKLTEEDLSNMIGKMTLTRVLVVFPRMKLETTVDLKDTLKMMGVNSLFDPNKASLDVLAHTVSEPQSLDSSFVRKNSLTQSIDNIRQSIDEQCEQQGSCTKSGLYADQIIHKVSMDITEVGTEAAAATAVSIARSGGVRFRVDVPFSFFIRNEETKTILFWGSVNLPNPHYVVSK